MWERASCSCSQENVFMGDLKSSVSPCSCHCTQWTGVASSVTENKYSSTQTTDISYRHDKSHLCLHVPHCASLVSLTWAAWQTTLPVSQELLRYRLIFLPSCFSEMAHQISVKCKHVQGRAGGWQGDWWRAAERPSACVCVCYVCRLTSGYGPSPPLQSLHLPRTPQEPASQMWSHSTGNFKFHHLNMVIHTHAMQPPLSLHCCKQGSQKHKVFAL